MKRILSRTGKLNAAIILLVLIIAAGNIFCTLLNRSSDSQHTLEIDKNSFAGSASCRNCHKNIYDSFVHTAHYLTSRPAAQEFIKGSFDSGKNIYEYNQFVKVEMDNVNDSFYQTEFINNIPIETESFDIVVGSGRKGQTYLYWRSNQLFQLPVSYYVPMQSWCNSPGYPSAISKFSRQIDAQCLECHGTYAKANATASGGTLFDKEQIIYGIECERCHGPAKQHVAFYTAHPNDTTSKFIINTKHLSRLQQLDGCALCHSGIRNAIQPPFSFFTGDTLSNYSTEKYNPDSSAMLDVHGNQYGLLTASKCFRSAQQMNCSTCHNVHEKETNNIQLFSQHCMSCHNNVTHDTCTLHDRGGIVLSNNCIDCHMPLLASRKIFLELSDPKKSSPDFVRTHKIAIYQKESAAFIEKTKANTK